MVLKCIKILYLVDFRLYDLLHKVRQIAAQYLVPGMKGLLNGAISSDTLALCACGKRPSSHPWWGPPSPWRSIRGRFRVRYGLLPDFRDEVRRCHRLAWPMMFARECAPYKRRSERADSLPPSMTAHDQSVTHVSGISPCSPE